MATRRKTATKALEAVQPSCQNCAAWSRYPSDTRVVSEMGQCLLNPPTVISGPDFEVPGVIVPVSVFPDTEATERCLQFRPLN